MVFTIRPNMGIDSVSFGMTAAEVRRALSAPFESFKRSESAQLPCDYFPSIGVFVYYKPPGAVEAVEFCSPASVTLEDENLLGMVYPDLLRFLRERDPATQTDAGMIISYFLGIGAHAPSATKDRRAKPESVIVFERGYYAAPLRRGADPGQRA